jgi:hypothetical protein
MTIYHHLYVKTHKITGLKYLGQTKRDPTEYRGSGKYWVPHLEQNGNDVDTNILAISTSKQEINNLGRYYSTIWNITTAMDDYGNKIWANEIPETGGGGSFGENHYMKKKGYIETRGGINGSISSGLSRPSVKEKLSGKNHHSFDSTIYQWRHEITKEVIKLTRQEFIQKFNCNPGNVCEHITGRRRIVNGWQIVDSKNYRPRKKPDQSGTKNSRYDHTVYHWRNNELNIECHMTRYDLIDKFKLHSGRICYVVSGKQAAHKGWALIR